MESLQTVDLTGLTREGSFSSGSMGVLEGLECPVLEDHGIEGGALGSILVPERQEKRVINLEKLISSVSGKHFPLFPKTSGLYLIFAPQYGITGFSESSLEQEAK